jgi:4-hydroxymandelate oxidase
LPLFHPGILSDETIAVVEPSNPPGRDRPSSLLELEEMAREKLDRLAFDYFAGGAHDERTLRENVAAYARIPIHHRVLVDVSRRSAETTVLGGRVSMPVLIAPTAFHRLAHADGEVATVRAAGAQGTVMILSSLSNTPVEEVVREASGAVWFQLYVYRDRAATEAVVARADAAGCRALVLTVDAPLIGMRERDVRNRFALPPGLSVANMLPAGYGAIAARPGESGLAAYIAEMLDPSITWKDIAWLRSLTKLPLVLKGIVRADDARRATDAGVDAIVVSNHGGRQLDTSPATIDVLPQVVDAVGGRCEVLVDGGVRRGTDVLKALALGARAVLLGRPVLWGLALDGRAGVEHVLGILRREIDLAMALAGCATVADVTRDLVDPTMVRGRVTSSA